MTAIKIGTFQKVEINDIVIESETIDVYFSNADHPKLSSYYIEWFVNRPLQKRTEFIWVSEITYLSFSGKLA